MLIEKKTAFTLITSDEKTFSEFYNNFLLEEKKHTKEHLILHISNNINANIKDFLLFLEIAKNKKQNGTSFVIINSNINIDDFPDHLNITPTLQEAEDVLDMENMERTLGF